MQFIEYATTGKKPPLAYQDLLGWMERRDEEQRIPTSDLEFPLVCFVPVSGTLTADECNSLYQCVDEHSPFFGPISFIKCFDCLVLHYGGIFPMPGWHAWMVQSRFLEYCQWKFASLPGYERWFDIIFLPKPGVSFGADSMSQKKALLPEQSEEQKKPRKKMYSLARSQSGIPGFVCGTCETDEAHMQVEGSRDEQYRTDTMQEENNLDC